MPETLKAPFPYYGGKRLSADTVWRKFGNVDGYIDPFAGSLAVLLRNPWGPAGRELIGDFSPYIANFWCSVKADPDAVAYHADYPTCHLDLRARHK